MSKPNWRARRRSLGDSVFFLILHFVNFHYLRSKYGNIDKRKGNPMLMKKLAGKKQYFDSGDYNMQKEKVKGPAVPNPLAAKNPSKIKGLIIQNLQQRNNLWL